MKVKSQMLNNNRVVGIHTKYNSSQSLKEKGKQYQPKKKPAMSPGHQHVPKLPILSQLQNQQRRVEKSWSDSEVQFQTLIQPMTLESTQGYDKEPRRKVSGSEESLLQSINKPLRINFHPDVGFTSGAWLFDLSAAPKWLKRELKEPAKVQSNSNQAELLQWMKELEMNPMPNVWTPLLTEDERVFETSGCWLFELNEMPLWFQKEVQAASQLKRETKTPWVSLNPTRVTNNLKTEPIPNTVSITLPSFINRFCVQQNQDEDVFYSGAWLFDESVVPAWLQSALISTPKSKNEKRSQKINSDTFSKNSFPSLPEEQQPLFIKEEDEMKNIDSGAWLFDLDCAPFWFRTLISQASTSNQTNTKSKKIVSGFSYHTLNEDQRDQVVYLNRVPIPSIKSVVHEDIGFYSGAWLFDENVMPEWFKKEIPSFQLRFSTLKKQTILSPKVSPLTQAQTKGKEFQLKTNHFNTSSISAKPFQVDEDYGFYNGGWLFNLDMAPVWLKEALSTTNSKITKSTCFTPASYFAKVDPNIYQTSSQPFLTIVSPTSAQLKFKLHCDASFSFLLTKRNKKDVFTPSSLLSENNYNHLKFSEIDFVTGAWLFDQTRVPDWMKKEVMPLSTRAVQPPRQAVQPQRRHHGLWKALKRPFWFIAYY